MTAAAARDVLNVMSAGAARGLVGAVKARFERDSGARVHATFGAVGTIRELIATGAPCDVLILTPAVLDPMIEAGRVDATSVKPLGVVHTGVAVREDAAAPRIADAQSLRTTLLAASALYVPDPERATAGIHCVAMLKRLGIAGELASRLRAYPHGAAAMEALARSPDAGALGCTQVTEIRYTPGVALVGTLPAPFELSTVYSIAVMAQARDVERAHALASLLAGPQTKDLRIDGGFEV